MKKYYKESRRRVLYYIQPKEGRLNGCHILRSYDLIKDVTEVKTEGRIEMTGRRGKRRKQLLDDFEEGADTGS
jgi:hypothetical protein